MITATLSLTKWVIEIRFWAARQTSRRLAIGALMNLLTGLKHYSRGLGVSRQKPLGSPAGWRKLILKEKRGRGAPFPLPEAGPGPLGIADRIDAG